MDNSSWYVHTKLKSLIDRVTSLEERVNDLTRPPTIQFQPLVEDLPVPQYQTDGSVGLDLMACIDEPFDLPAGSRTVVKCGFATAIPEGYEIQIRPRSGLAAKAGVTVLNSPGTIDADFRGEFCVILINHGVYALRIEPGYRIAQMVVCPVAKAKFIVVDSLPETVRGEGKFGSTGI